MRDNKHTILNKKWFAVLFTLLVMTLCCLGVAAYLRSTSGSNMYAFLYWDMFLAWAPLLISSLIAYVFQRKAVRPGWMGIALTGLLGLLWLFFLPNAAYLFTEMLHSFRYFTAQPGSPFWFHMNFWYSLTLTFGVAIVGILLSTYSVMQIHRVIHLVLHKSGCWIVVGFILLLSSLGVYIGRFNRWNSWDIVSRPEQIVIDLVNDFNAGDSILVEFVLILFIVQAFAYVMISLFDCKNR